MKNSLVVPALIIGVALVIVGNGVINYFDSQQSFALKQKCHDEANTYISNKQTTFEKQIKYDNSTQSTALLTDSYNKSLNTCITLWILNTKSDAIKYPNLGDSTTEYIDDALTGKNLAFWYTYYNSQTSAETSSGGTINGKDINNRNDFNNEINTLLGKNSVGYIDAPISPIPTLPSTNTNLPTSTPTQVTQSYIQIFLNTCSFGSIYCTCLYDSLHRIDPGNEAADYIAESGNGNNAPMINAYAECNSRFSSK